MWKKIWRSIPNKLNIEGWDYKKLRFNKELKKDQSQPVLIFKTCDPSHEYETNSIEGKS
jgi:hypothetical protein